MNEFNAIYKEFSEETHCYHYIIRKVSDVCISLMSKVGISSESVQCAMLNACDACADMGQL